MTEVAEIQPGGAFVASLKRTNKQIKDDRAEAICEAAQITMRRAVEDLELTLKRLRRDRENMLDMSPENTHSLILGKDFDAQKFVETEATIGLDIRNTEIKLEILSKRYTYLFGGE